jgi:hypothetical protein
MGERGDGDSAELEFEQHFLRAHGNACGPDGGFAVGNDDFRI